MSTYRHIAPTGADSPTSSVSSISPKRSKYQHDDKAWEAIKPTIYQLYIQEKQSAEEVLDTLTSNSGNPFNTRSVDGSSSTKLQNGVLEKNKKRQRDLVDSDFEPVASGSSGPVVSLSPTTRDSQIEDTPNLDSVSQISGDSATPPITPTEPAEPICQGEDGDMHSQPSESGDTMDDNDTSEHLLTLDVLVDIFDKRFHLVDAEDKSTSEVKSSSKTNKPPNDLFANAGSDFADNFVCFPDQQSEHVSDPATTTAGVFAEDQHDECCWGQDLERWLGNELMAEILYPEEPGSVRLSEGGYFPKEVLETPDLDSVVMDDADSPPDSYLSCNTGQDTQLERGIDALDYAYQDAETGWFTGLDYSCIPDYTIPDFDPLPEGNANHRLPILFHKWTAELPEPKSNIRDTARDCLIAIADLDRCEAWEGQKLTPKLLRLLDSTLVHERRERMRQFRVNFIEQYNMLQKVIQTGSSRLHHLAEQLESRHSVWQYAMSTMRGLARLKAPSTLRDVVSFLCVSRAVVESSQGDKPAQLLEFSHDLEKWNLAFPEIGDVARHMWGIELDGNSSCPRSYNVFDPSGTSCSADFITKLKESVVSLIGKTVGMFGLDEDSVTNHRHHPAPNPDTPSQQSVTPNNSYLSSSEHLGPTHAHRRKRKRQTSGGTLAGETSSKPRSPGVERLYDLTSRDKRFSVVAVKLATGFIFAIVIFFILCMIHACIGAAVPFGLAIDPWRPTARQSEPGDEVAQAAPSFTASSLAEQSELGTTDDVQTIHASCKLEARPCSSNSYFRLQLRHGDFWVF
ncbi:hypothetical protein V8F33_011821 [Rhypophila sp. PSN 637]